MSDFDFLDDLIIGTPASPDPPPVELTMNEMKLADVTNRLEALQSKLNVFQEVNTKPIESDISSIKDEQKKAKQIYDQLIEQLNIKYQERLNELYKYREEQRNLQNELDQISREQTNLLKQIAAEKLLKNIEEKIDWLIADSPWGIQARAYQLIDLKYMVAAFEAGKNGVLNALDMGLGKTFESAALDYCLQHLFQEKFGRRPTVLWMTAPSLIKQTVREIKKWNPQRMIIPIEGSWNKEQREYAAKMGIDSNAMVIINYEQMGTNKVIMNTEWDIVFADEVSKLKGGANPSKPTKVWQNAKALLWEVDDRGNFTDYYNPKMKCKFFVPLSGTPIQNKPGDMWAYLHLFNPSKFPRLKRFTDEYAYGWPERKVNFERLINVISDQVIRRSKDDELDLPPKVYLPVEVEMTPAQRELYDSMKENFFIYLNSKKEEHLSAKVVIEWIIRLWEIALYPGIIKMFDAHMNEIPVECQESAILDEAMEIITQSIAADEKVVVWSSWFKPPLYELKRRLDKEDIKSAVYTGDQTNIQKDDAVVSFTSKDENSVQVLLCGMKVAGLGLNLQENCSTTILLDLWWNYATNEQAIDRLHRPGQVGPRVMIHQLQAADSVYAFVKAKADSKQEMAESIMESRELRKGQDWITYLEGMI